MKQAKFPFVFGAGLASFLVVSWVLARLGVMQMDGTGGVGYSLFILLFCLPLAVLLWFRVFDTPVAVRIEGGDVVLGSMDLFPKTIRIPIDSVKDARVTEKKVLGEPLLVLRLTLAETSEVTTLRSKLKSSPYFGFDGQFFETAPSVGRSRVEELADQIRSSAVPIDTRGQVVDTAT